MKNFFNTTKENGTLLIEFDKLAEKQENEILSLFQQKQSLTPSDVLVLTDNILLTSIRRSITNLTKKGKLIKSDEKKVGIYGRKEYIWLINNEL